MLTHALIQAVLAGDPAVLRGDDRWRELSPADLRVLDDHGLVPLAARLLREAGIAVPAALDARTRLLAVRRLLLEASLREIGEAASGRGVRVATSRAFGPVADLYPRPECRPTADLDLVVRAREFEPAVACLGELGYGPAHACNPGARRRGPVRVDLMSGLSGLVRITGLPREARNFPGLDGLWDAALLPVAADGVHRLRLPVEFLLAALHYAYKHRFARHIWGLDLLLLARSMSGGEMRETLALAREVRVAHLLAAALRRAAALAPAPPPALDGFLAALPSRDPHPLRRFLLARPPGKEAGKDAGMLLALACAPGPAAALSLAGGLWLRAVRRRGAGAAVAWVLRLPGRLLRALAAGR